ncbi:hypothetical protein ALC60_03928, partial [Trachymyrmex zeteki]
SRLIFVSQRYRILFNHYHSGGPAIPLDRGAAGPARWSARRGRKYILHDPGVSALQDRLLMFPSLGNPVISPT